MVEPRCKHLSERQDQDIRRIHKDLDMGILHVSQSEHNVLSVLTTIPQLGSDVRRERTSGDDEETTALLVSEVIQEYIESLVGSEETQKEKHPSISTDAELLSWPSHRQPCSDRHRCSFRGGMTDTSVLSPS